ncbi:MAG: hypothetical protein VR78_02885 [Hoeflea sp. BRH_c9]|nr:MAG: hypothetical protein VR78_02885 [Hoeflea sp. BRH_c9]
MASHRSSGSVQALRAAPARPAFSGFNVAKRRARQVKIGQHLRIAQFTAPGDIRPVRGIQPT